MTTETVIQCLSELFCLFGYPLDVHSDRGASFMSQELKRYLTERGIASSKTTPYHPTENAQCKRINQTIWRTVKLLLRTYKESENCWEAVLPEALHAVRSLLCTATNATPHERFLEFNRRSTSGRALPSFLIQQGPVLLRRFIRSKRFIRRSRTFGRKFKLFSCLFCKQPRIDGFNRGSCPETCRRFQSYKCQTNNHYRP